MPDENPYDMAIVGGGLAGLALAIQSSREDYRTILFEKEHYPFHKVCGEYISLESWNFLEELGIPLSQMDLPRIDTLIVSSPNGNYLKQALPLGGFGISRYTLDHMLAGIARRQGATIREGCRVDEIEFDHDLFTIHSKPISTQARITAGSWGKRSNLDVKWGRPFANRKNHRLNNFIAVKYHIQTDWPENEIALHNFPDGYCGISKVDGDRFCLCYLTTARNLQRCGNSIQEMEQRILCGNPFLRGIFDNARIMYEDPLTIAQISFDPKSQTEHHLLMTGDAAGMITPLCGNGMSMALHASKLAFETIHEYLAGHCSRPAMEQEYRRRWSRHFHARLRTGRLIQRFFGHPLLSNLLVTTLKPFPGLTRRIIRATHGDPF